MTISLSSEEIDTLCSQVDPKQLENVQGFVVFLGHAHSGHSLIGALLDSHPHTAITNEVNVAKMLVDHELDTQQLMSIILATSFANKEKDAWFNTGYSYKTATGFQGTTKYPQIIGDKKGGGNTRIIRKHPHVLKHLHDLLGDKLKFIQVIRDPYDNIAAFSHYWKEPVSISHVNRYFENLETAIEIENSGYGSFYKLYYSDFMTDPRATFIELLGYLSLEADHELLDTILKIVRKKEHKRSKKINWDPLLRDEIAQRINYFKNN